MPARWSICSMVEYGVVLFHSPSHALRAETVLQRAGFSVKLIPTPRQISSDCGMALRFEGGHEERIAALLAESQVPVKGFHTIQVRGPARTPANIVDRTGNDD